jgi:hypothetical protein
MLLLGTDAGVALSGGFVTLPAHSAAAISRG